MKPRKLHSPPVSHSAFWALVIVLLCGAYMACVFLPELLGGR